MKRRQLSILPLLPLLLILLMQSVAPAADTKPADYPADGESINLASPRYTGLFKELTLRYHFDRHELDRMFAGLSIKKRVLELMDKQWEARPYYLYYPRFITDEVLEEGREKMRLHAGLLAEIEKKYGVDREIVTAIWGIETKYGQHKGAFNVFQTLNTMFDAYPRRRAFYRRELIQFILLCRENKVDPLTVSGSYGGAFGQTQFIPSSFREYAVDFDGDGRKDVWQSTPDILASIANYLHRYGWVLDAPIYRELGGTLMDQRLTDAYHKGRKGFVAWRTVREAQGVELAPPPGGKDLTIVGLEIDSDKMRYVAGYPNFQAITAWNHSNRYAMAVTELAEGFIKTHAEPADNKNHP